MSAIGFVYSDLTELIARIHSLSRRHRGYSSNILSMGDLELHQETQQAYYQQQPLTLSRREYSLLETFMLYPNQVLKTDQLIDKTYGFQDSIESNAINVHIHHLRHKTHPDLIQTVRGVGYILKITTNHS